MVATSEKERDARAETWVDKLAQGRGHRSKIPIEVPYLLATADNPDSVLHFDCVAAEGAGDRLGYVSGMAVCILQDHIIRVRFTDLLPAADRSFGQPVAEIVPTTAITRIEVRGSINPHSPTTQEKGLVTVQFGGAAEDLELPLTARPCDLAELVDLLQNVAGWRQERSAMGRPGLAN